MHGPPEENRVAARRRVVHQHHQGALSSRLLSRLSKTRVPLIFIPITFAWYLQSHAMVGSTPLPCAVKVYSSGVHTNNHLSHNRSFWQHRYVLAEVKRSSRASSVKSPGRALRLFLPPFPSLQIRGPNTPPLNRTMSASSISHWMSCTLSWSPTVNRISFKISTVFICSPKWQPAFARAWMSGKSSAMPSSCWAHSMNWWHWVTEKTCPFPRLRHSLKWRVMRREFRKSLSGYV